MNAIVLQPAPQEGMLLGENIPADLTPITDGVFEDLVQELSASTQMEGQAQTVMAEDVLPVGENQGVESDGAEVRAEGVGVEVRAEGEGAEVHVKGEDGRAAFSAELLASLGGAPTGRPEGTGTTTAPDLESPPILEGRPVLTASVQYADGPLHGDRAELVTSAADRGEEANLVERPDPLASATLNSPPYGRASSDRSDGLLKEANEGPPGGQPRGVEIPPPAGDRPLTYVAPAAQPVEGAAHEVEPVVADLSNSQTGVDPKAVPVAPRPTEEPQAASAPARPGSEGKVEGLQQPPTGGLAHSGVGTDRGSEYGDLPKGERPRGVEAHLVGNTEEGTPLKPETPQTQGLEVTKVSSPTQVAGSARDVSLSGPQATPVRVERLVEKVVELVQAGPNQKNHEVTLQLHPPALGKVHLRVLMEDAKLQVALVTSSHHARELVESQVLQLKTALSHQGLELEHFSVDVQAGFAHTMTQQDEAWNKSLAWTPSSETRPASPQEQTAEGVISMRRDERARIDLFI